jgi:8-oxo-dGTP pyrophosphatase MutT (NUDIX family)
MTLGPWEILEERPLAKTRWLDAREETCRTPSGAIVSDYTVLHYTDWSVAAAIAADGRLVMTRQWRQGAQALSLEFAGGVVDPGETPEAAAGRELLEETGHRGVEAGRVLKVRPNPATQRNWFHVTLFTECEKVAEPMAHETEKLELVLLTPEEAVAAIRSGALIHGLQVGAIFATLDRLNRGALKGGA